MIKSTKLYSDSLVGILIERLTFKLLWFLKVLYATVLRCVQMLPLEFLIQFIIRKEFHSTRSDSCVP